MSQLKLDPTWILELDTHDLRLVLMALGGRLKPEVVDAARQLGDRLTQNRIKHTQSYIDVLKSNLSSSNAGPKSYSSSSKNGSLKAPSSQMMPQGHE